MQHRFSVATLVVLALLFMVTAGCSGGSSNSPTPTTPSITTLSITSATVGSGSTQLTVTGTNFTSTSIVQWASSGVATTFVSSTQLTATIPASNLTTAGTFSITVHNPDANTTSNAVTFTVSASGPAVSALSPSSILAGSAGFTLRVSGSGYASGSVINWNSTALTTSFLSTSQLSAQIPASLVAASGAVNITVTTPAPNGGTSSAQPFNVDAPLPAITTLNPSNVIAGSPGITLTVYGANFVANSMVRIGSTDKTTTFISSTQLTADIPAADIATSGLVGITVSNPTPGGGVSNSSNITVAANTGTHAPVANAGTGQTVAVASTVYLDGGRSTSGGNPLTYSWSLASRPAGSAAVLSSASAVQPTFIADAAGNYTLQLVVNDGTTTSAPSTVTISTVNSAPVANAGPDQTVLFGATVQLDGGHSTDADGNSLTYNWTLTSAPSGSAASLASASSPRPTFVIDRPGNYVAQLIVNDGSLASAPSTVTISTINSLPVADAGSSQSVALAATVYLDGSHTSDVDGDPLSYRWAILSAPAGSNATISTATDVRPTFVADRAGLYVLQLTANDGTADGAPSTMTVSTINTPPVANAGLDQAITAGSTVQLDGSASTDPDGNPLSYRWALVSKPAGSTASVANPASVRSSFSADVAGAYIAQLIVNDGQVNSAPSLVNFSTANSRPVANAGSPQKVAAGTTVQLDAGGSTDPDGNVLTYRWSLLSKPAGSVAFLANATLPTPTFIADKAGDYVAEVIVSDATLVSVPSTVTISTTAAAPIANASTGRTVTAGTLVQLDGAASNDPGGNTLTYSWSLITAPAGSAAVLGGANTRTPSFTADVAGEYVTQLIVNNGALSSAPVTVQVSTVSSRPIANAGPSQQVLVGTNVSLDGSASNSPDGHTLTFKWSLLSVPQGSTATLSNSAALSPSITIDQRGLYVAQLIVSDGVYSSAPATVEITTNNRPPVANAGTDQTVAVGTTVTLDGTGSTDPDGLPLSYQWTFTSLPEGSNPTLTGSSKVTFVPDAVGTYVVQLVVSDGLLASAPATVTITTTPNTNISFTPSPLAMSANDSQNLTVILGQAAGTGGVVVNLASSDTNVATVPTSITVPSGTTTATFTVTSKAVTGTTNVTGTATGFTTGTVAVNVTARTLTFPALTVGKDMQVGTQLTLSTNASTSGVSITLTSSDASKLTLSTAPNSTGTASITLKVAASALTSPTFYVQSLASSGTVTLTAQGSGYADGTTAVTLAPGGFFVSNNLDSIDTTTFSPDTTFTIAAGALDPVTLKPLAIQQLRAGISSVSVKIDNPNTAAGTVVTNPLVFSATNASKDDTFHPLAIGSMTLTITPPSGFTAPSLHGVIPTTVTAPAINVGNVSVGKDMQLQDGVWLEVGAPTGGADITLTSSDPSKVLLSTSPTTAGSGSITQHFGAGYTGQLYFYVQALANTGSVTLSAKGTATLNGATVNYADGSATVTLLPSGFVINNGDITNASVGGGDVPIGVVPAALQSGTLNLAFYQQLRPGVGSINVGVNSSNTAVGTITTSPVVFSAGDQSQTTALHPVGAGGTMVSVTTPAGFSTPSQFQSISATVQGAGINTNTNLNTGKDLITSSSFALSTTPVAPVTATVTSNNTAVATLSTSSTVAGGASVSFPNTSGQLQSFYVQGIAAGTTTLTINAPGYTDATVTVTVYPSGFILTKNSFSTTAGTDTTITVAPAVLLPGSLDVFDVQPLRPGVTVQVPITSSDTSIGTVVSPIAVTVGSGSTSFHAIATGTTNLTLGTPAGYSTPNLYQTITATVQ